MQGLCECGCGGATTIAPQSHKKHGYIRGEPRRFIVGHNNRKPRPLCACGCGERVNGYRAKWIKGHDKRGKPGKSNPQTIPDMTGQRFGLLTVVARAGSTPPPASNALWQCRCDCGGETKATGSDLKRGRAKSCGCRIGNHRHDGHGTPTYNTWRNMRRRCRSPKSTQWEYYGGRGITVCDRWLDFENFLADMGERPEGLTLDRVDVDGNYEPGNCRWATASEQASNKRPKGR